MALSKSASMAWILGLCVLVIICIMAVLLIVAMPKFRIIQYLIDKLNLVARETLNGLMVIRAFGRGDFERQRFEQANIDVMKTNLFIQRAMVFMMPIMMVFMNVLAVLVIWVGAQQVAASAMQVGDMMAFIQYAMLVVMSFMFVAMMFIVIPRAAVSARRINEVLETTPVITDPPAPREFSDLPAAAKGRIQFKDVSFRYEGSDENTLCDISFTAEPGKTTAFIGSTGAGKTTLLNLIPRFYDATSGEVLVNGINVRDVRQHDLRARIGYVAQKSMLLSGTVAENIAYGDPGMSAARIEEAARIAQADEFIAKLEVEQKDEIKGSVSALGAGKQTATDKDLAKHSKKPAQPQATEQQPAPRFSLEGFNFDVAQGGGNVSGGQRQRLSIARALAIDPQILLFDDSFSALDFKTDAALRRAIKQYAADTTVIIVAQRVSTIMDANQIYVIDEGRIVGHGSHNELLRSCPAYYEIASSQLGADELQQGGGADA
jgi:ATP-binding cassette subfamily B protein